MALYSTKDMVRLSGAKKQQVIYLRERGILPVVNGDSVLGSGYHYLFDDEGLRILREWLVRRRDILKNRVDTGSEG